ncbi:RIP metalloprotease RseP [Ruegeria faecimaris]|uniref:Zinc metalloprotease n=1 Tax=Ruegeria faecimaris TaxID=686389 RepID=A0A521B670_9RHOB|nr:RIP metalloprotease RseP [Ruegeria faecimaris]SMO42589.1 regulator of sigma E protease [Ruegeria faecimaris]
MDVLSLIPQFGNLIYTIFAFVIALSAIVAVHEYGHYIVGRWSGIYAEVFSIGFGPVLWSRIDKRGTRWQIAALPFGGYVKFLGDANAASGKDEAAMSEISEQSPEELRRTMHGAPLWARTATVAAGPIFNFAMSILVFALIFFTQGATRDPLTVGSLHPLPGTVQELREGDEIHAIAGIDLPDFEQEGSWSEFVDSLPVDPVLDYTVLRDGDTLDVSAPWLFPPLIQQVVPRSAAMDISLAQGDVITAVNGDPVYAFEQLKDHVEGSDGRPLLLNVWRDGAELEFALAPRRTDEPQSDGGFVTHWRIGIVGGMMLEPATERAGILTSLGGGVRQTLRIIDGSLSGIWHMVTGAISTCNMSGPIGIAETSGAMASQGAQNFIFFIAVLSTAVGLLNLFPIPALDGGHLVFYAYEAISGKPPSDKALRILMGIGVSIILALMLFSVSNDLFC